MKKQWLIFSLALLLSACADKNEYTAAILVEMQKEQDIKDYNIDPEYMTDCVVDLSSKNMDGMFPFDPARMTAYRNYTIMLTLTQFENPKETLTQLTKDFGSVKNLAVARINYAESISRCLTSVISKTEGKEKEKTEATTDN